MTARQLACSAREVGNGIFFPVQVYINVAMNVVSYLDNFINDCGLASGFRKHEKINIWDNTCIFTFKGLKKRAQVADKLYSVCFTY